jgi:GT2 family glycosyltransferase
MAFYPLLSIILVNWNRSQDTLDCVQSIGASTYPNYNIIVVDNGSCDHSLMKLRQNQSKYILLEAGSNLGFTGGNNLGICHALDINADYVLLLNNDTFVAPDALEKIVRVADLDKQIGIVTPKILFHPQRHLVWAAGTDYDSRYLAGYLTGYKLKDSGRTDRERDLVWATGCAMLIRSSIISDVGILCNDYFAVGEDLDYCLRVAEKGYRIRYEPSAIIWHKESASSGGHDAPQYVYYQTRNLLLLRMRWSKNFKIFLRSLIFILLYFTKRTIMFSLKGNWRSIMGVFYGIRDGFTNHLGRREYPFLLWNRQQNKIQL